MSYRPLSLFVGVSLLAIATWAMASRLGPVGDPVVLFGLLGLLAAGLGGVLFFALRAATAGSAVYWRTEDAPHQSARILAMILCTLVVQMAITAYFDQQGRLGQTADATFLVIWTVFPALFLTAKFVKWPLRVLRSSVLRIVIVGSIAIVLAATLTSFPILNAIHQQQILPKGNWPLALGEVILGATAEEIVWRVLLLTALLQATGSRFQAVFLSGVGFAMVHAPLALMQPVLRADWPMLQFAVHAYAPEFLMQAAVGCLLGVVWLRTGSIALIVLTHTILNLGPSLVLGV